MGILRLGAVLLVIASCGASHARCPEVPAAGTALRPSRSEVPVLVGAGDIADCDGCAASTAALLDRIPGTVFMAGDGAYREGSAAQYEACYEPTWGRHKARTRPAVGNHEYGTKDAAGYFEYFGAAAGTPGQGWYSFDVGTWHVVVLNSNCWEVGCEEGSPQLEWLKADLAASEAECTAAIFHHALFSSGKHGEHRFVSPFWEVLYRHGVELVINGHDHSYERLAPITPWGVRDRARGIREFVVGTGGVGHHEWPRPPLSVTEVRNSGSFGVLKLELHDGRYEWEFVPAEEGGFRDEGSGTCHGGRPRDPEGVDRLDTDNGL